MSWNTWFLFAVTETILCLTPGPAVLFVLSHGLARGGRSALWANAGILTGNTFYFLLSSAGLGAVLLASHQVFTILKYAGAAYLVYLGVKTILGAGLALQARVEDHAGAAGRRTLVRGFALQAANPKALIFFVALLPQFIDADGPIPLQIAILGITSVVIEFCVLASYGYLAERAARVAQTPKFVTLTNRLSGGMLVGAGVGIAVSSE